MDDGGYWKVPRVASELHSDGRWSWVEIRSLGFVHLGNVFTTEFAGVHLGMVTSRNGLIESGWSTEHGAQLARLVIFTPGR